MDFRHYKYNINPSKLSGSLFGDIPDSLIIVSFPLRVHSLFCYFSFGLILHALPVAKFADIKRSTCICFYSLLLFIQCYKVDNVDNCDFGVGY